MLLWGDNKMSIVHCSSKFEPDSIWILSDNDEYTRRRVELVECPICGSKLCKEFYTRTGDGQRFSSSYSNKHAEKRLEQLKKDIIYRTDQLKIDNALRGFVYGENKEKVINGETHTIQKAVDWYGTKKLVKDEVLQ
jgi:hypothetical protein